MDFEDQFMSILGKVILSMLVFVVTLAFLGILIPRIADLFVRILF